MKGDRRNSAFRVKVNLVALYTWQHLARWYQASTEHSTEINEEAALFMQSWSKQSFLSAHRRLGKFHSYCSEVKLSFKNDLYKPKWQMCLIKQNRTDLWFKWRRREKFTTTNLPHIIRGQEAARSRILATWWRFKVSPHGHHDADRLIDVCEKPATLRLQYNLFNNRARLLFRTLPFSLQCLSTGKYSGIMTG